MADQAPSRRLAAALCLVLGLAALDAGAQPTNEAERYSGPDILPPPKLSVRQGGGGDDRGLLTRVRGPAAMLEFGDARRSGFRSLAGARDGGGGERHGYVAGVGRGSLLGLVTTLSYAADETGSSAVETRVAKSLEGVQLSLSQTYNHGFESEWTGRGEGRALHMTEAGADWNPLGLLPVGFAVRETRHADGSDSKDFRTAQTLLLGSGMVVNSTSTRLGAAGAEATSGNLLYYGPAGPVQLSAGFDYGGSYGMRPGVLRVGAEKSLDRSWSLYAYADHPLASAMTRVDLGASRDFGGFLFSAFAGGTRDGAAYGGLRINIPLLAAARNDPWLGF